MQDESIRLNVNAAIVRDGHLLVIEFRDDKGTHFNLPGGGVEIGETLEMALKRECLEEARAEVTVGRLLLLWEYVPTVHGAAYGPRQKVGNIFHCELRPGCEPSLPKKPDADQISVKWIALADLAVDSPCPPLYPTVGKDLAVAIANPNSTIQVISRL